MTKTMRALLGAASVLAAMSVAPVSAEPVSDANRARIAAEAKRAPVVRRPASAAMMIGGLGPSGVLRRDVRAWRAPRPAA